MQYLCLVSAHYGDRELPGKVPAETVRSLRASQAANKKKSMTEHLIGSRRW